MRVRVPPFSFLPFYPPILNKETLWIQDSKAAAAAALHQDNERLNAELREARAQIRNLELQVESLKANARKAAAALLDN